MAVGRLPSNKLEKTKLCRQAEGSITVVSAFALGRRPKIHRCLNATKPCDGRDVGDAVKPVLIGRNYEVCAQHVQHLASSNKAALLDPPFALQFWNVRLN